jgi:hypothetical protein
MEGEQFDRLARQTATGLDRRIVARSLAAGVLAESGSAASCCWFGTCGSQLCTEQYPN